MTMLVYFIIGAITSMIMGMGFVSDDENAYRRIECYICIILCVFIWPIAIYWAVRDEILENNLEREEEE